MAAATLVAAFVRGYSGFGYSALVIAASSLVTNPLNFVAVVVLLEFAMSLQAWRGAGRMSTGGGWVSCWPARRSGFRWGSGR